MENYRPKDTSNSPRFCGNRTFMRLTETKELENVNVAILGVPFDTGTTYRTGQRLGPSSIREASLLLRLYNHDLDVDIFKYCSAIDYGDVSVIPGDIHESYARMKNELVSLLEANVIPICLGGDHSISLGELRALKDTIGPVAMVHFDSHTDTWDTTMGLKYTHANPFVRAIEEGCILTDHSIQVGIRGPGVSKDDLSVSRNLGLEVITGSDLHNKGVQEVAQIIKNRVGDAPVFITFDIDFLDPAYAPGTGTPEIGGFTTWEAMQLLRESLIGLNCVAFDMVEVLPTYDSGEITAYAASGLIFEFLSIIAYNKKMELEEKA